MPSLVGSEMCIRDSPWTMPTGFRPKDSTLVGEGCHLGPKVGQEKTRQSKRTVAPVVVVVVDAAVFVVAVFGSSCSFCSCSCPCSGSCCCSFSWSRSFSFFPVHFVHFAVRCSFCSSFCSSFFLFVVLPGSFFSLSCCLLRLHVHLRLHKTFPCSFLALSRASGDQRLHRPCSYFLSYSALCALAICQV